MTKETQMNWVKAQFSRKGRVSRNEALARRITRLSARILDLRNAGLDITAEWIKTRNGRDYVYTINN